jgi:hypothetical protein
MPKKKKQQRTRTKSAKKTTPKRKVRNARASKWRTAKRKTRRITAASKRFSLARKMKFSAKRKKVTSTGLVMETAPLSSVERREKELLEEGNALEAEAKQGVENALDADQGEVEDEVAEDDVPQEYLDKDQ